VNLSVKFEMSLEVQSWCELTQVHILIVCMWSGPVPFELKDNENAADVMIDNNQKEISEADIVPAGAYPQLPWPWSGGNPIINN